MIRALLLPRLLMVLAIITLAVAPLPATARGGMPVEATSMMEGMECCPPGDPMMPDCQKSCPDLALCMAKCFLATTVVVARMAYLDATAHSHQLSPDEAAMRRTIIPPAPPPRIQG